MKKIRIYAGIIIVLILCCLLFSSITESQTSTSMKPSQASQQREGKDAPCSEQPAMELNIHVRQFLQESAANADSTVQPTEESSSGLWIAVGAVLFNLIIIALMLRYMKR